AIGDVLRHGRIVAFPDDRGLVAARRQVTIEARGGRVQRAVLEPLDRYVAGEARVLDLGRRLHPGDAATLLGPEAVGVARGALEHVAIAFGGHVRLGSDFGPDREEVSLGGMGIWHRLVPSLFVA